MKMLLILAWRNLWRNKRRSVITISSVVFAVVLAILFYSMEQGTYQNMIDTMVRYSTGYIQIQDVKYEEEPTIDYSLSFDQELKDLLDSFDEQIAYQVPRLQGFALAATGNKTRGALVTGIDPAKESRLNDLPQDLVRGDFLEEDDRDILISEGLSDRLKASTGDTLVLLGHGFQGTTAAGKYRIKGIVALQNPEMDNQTIYMSLEQARWFYAAPNRLTALIIMPENPDNTAQLAYELRKGIDQEWYQVLTWRQLLEDLLALMQFDTAGTMVMLLILYIVIAFGLFGTILTMIMERQREFAMLISLGMKRSQLALMNFVETLYITLSGVMIGVIVSFPILGYFYYHPIRLSGDMAEALSDYGFEPILPFSYQADVFLNQALVVMIISVVIGLYPIYKVYRMNIIEAKQ